MILDEINKFISDDDIQEVEDMANYVKRTAKKLNKNIFDQPFFEEMSRWFDPEKIKNNIHLILWKAGIDGDKQLLDNFK